MPAASDRLKQTWLRMLQAGAGSLIVAAAVISAPPARAAAPPAQSGIEERVQQARQALGPGLPGPEHGKDTPDRLAWWGNRIGVRVVPAWPNWPNWHNWHNWGNYGPWGNY